MLTMFSFDPTHGSQQCPNMAGGTAPPQPSSVLCPALVRSETWCSASTASTESPGTLARRRSLAKMLQDDAEDPRRRSSEGEYGEEEGLARPSRRRRSIPKHYQLPPPLVAASGEEERGPRDVQEPTPPSQLKQSSSREKLQRLMSAPVIDWEEIRKAQEHHYENQAQRSGTAGPGLASRRNYSMYSRTPSHMRSSIERLDEAVTGLPKKQPNHQARQGHELRVPTDANNLQRNASWCFSNGVVVRDKRFGLARRGPGRSSTRNAGLTLIRRKPSAPGALSLAKPQVRRQRGNASWSIPPCEHGMAPPLSPAARKAAWDMEVKATLDAARADLLQGQL